MRLLFGVVQSILNLGATVILPIMITLLGLSFGMKFKSAIIAGMTVGIGFAGLNLVISLLYQAISPAQTYYSAMGTGFRVVDVPWPLLGGAYWAAPFAILVVPVGVVLNLLIFRFTKIKVINVDIWNYINFLGPGTMAWALSGSLVVGFLVAVVLSIVALIFAQLNSTDWQEYFGLEGTTCSTLIFCAWEWPLFSLINRIIDKIPGLNKVDIKLGERGESSESAWGSILGSPIFIGLSIGALLAVITKQPGVTVLQMATTMAAVMFLMPRMAGILMEGLSSVGTFVSSYMKKRTSGEDSANVLIGMDVALGLKDPVAITTGILMIPIIIGFTFIVPGVSFFPIGIIAGIPYTAVFAAMCGKGNLFRSLLFCIFFVVMSMIFGTILQPEWTKTLTTAGIAIGSPSTSAGFDPWIITISMLNRLFGHGL